MGAVSGGGVAAGRGIRVFAHTSSRSESKQKAATVPPQTTEITPLVRIKRAAAAAGETEA